MEQTAQPLTEVTYSIYGVEKKVAGDVVGQMMLCPAHWFEQFASPSGEWVQDQSGLNWDIMHIKSNRLIEQVHCSKEVAMQIIEDLRQFDFDQYWTQYNQGIRDPLFVKRVSWLLYRWLPDGNI